MAESASAIAYKKAVKITRDPNNLSLPEWLKEFRSRMPEPPPAEEEEEKDESVPDSHRLKEAEMAHSKEPYLRLAWFMHSKVTSQGWFEAFVMFNILMIGVATGLDLEFSDDPSPAIIAFVDFVGSFTVTVFTCECGFKLIAEGYHPDRYFTDVENGAFNTFDFVIVVSGFALASIGGGAIAALRMLRLVRLLTFIKGVQQLRVIVSGLVTGLKSVSYIVMLLMLIIYIAAILACLFFGENDPARFGSVAMAMLSLFQISTLASWTSIVYTTWYGCGNFLGDPYLGPDNQDNPSMIHTNAGSFEGYKCDVSSPSPGTAFFFFSLYIVLTSWVIMSLFIGVITMGMFDAFEKMKTEIKDKRYQQKLEENARTGGNGGSKLGAMIKSALTEEVVEIRELSLTEERLEYIFAQCKEYRDAPWFSNVVTAAIITVGLMIGIETDQFMSCERHANKFDDATFYAIERCDPYIISILVGHVSNFIFTVECLIKILAEGYNTSHFFKDGWNCLDFFVVTTVFFEMTPARVIFEAFPVVVLRLLRLLRVFRLAKALPRLRSIVEALMQGFSAVGWICILIVVFNYIIACMCMLFLKKNDPFHFGQLLRAMFNVLRIETKDSWDQIMYIAMFGCEGYPAGYPFLNRGGSASCEDSIASGWLGAFLLLFIIIFGAYVLPTVLIGIVAISFEEATQRSNNMQDMLSKMEKVVEDTESKMPGYCTPKRVQQLKEVFEEMDADDELSLDMNEMIPFYQISFKILFDMEPKTEQMEALFHLMDTDGSTELGFAEFFLFVVVIKQIEAKCVNEPDYARRTFSNLSNRFISKEEEEAEAAKTETKAEETTIIDDMMESSEPKLTKEERNARDGNFLEEVVIDQCDQVAAKFLPPEASDAEFNDLSDRLYARITSELLLAAHTDSEVAGGELLNHFRGNGTSRPMDARQRAAAAGNMVDDLLARVTNTMGQHNAMSQMGYPSQSPGQQPSPAAASQATSSLINLPTSGPDVFNGISGGGGSGVEMPPFPTATLGSELESTHGGSQLPLIERRLRDKAAGEMGRHTRSGNANGGHSGGGSGVEMTGVPVGRLGGGRGGNEPQSALAAVAWRRILAFLAAHTDKAEQLEGLFGRADRDGDGTLTVHEIGELMVSLGVPLDKSAPGTDLKRAFFVDLDVNGDGRISLDEFLATVEKRTNVITANTSTAWKEIIKCMDYNGLDASYMFEKYDANSNGLLSASELQALLHEVGAKVSDTQFALFQEEMDLNRDGRIGRGEFIHAVAANRRHLENAANPRENNSVFGKLANMPDKAPVGPTEADRQYDADAKQAALAAVAWRRVLSFLAAHPEKAEQLEGLFGSADEDGGGTLTVHEIGELMVTLGVPLEKSAPGVDLKRAFFIDLDINGDGHISLDEFLATVEKRTAHITADTSVAWGEIIKCMDYNRLDASALFEKYDTNMNGLLSANELRALLREMGAQVSDTQFSLFQEEMDLNSDGRIGRGEFMNAVARNRRQIEASSSSPNQTYGSITGNHPEPPNSRNPSAPQGYSNHSSVPSGRGGATGGVGGAGGATAGASSAAAWQKVMGHLQQVPSAAAAIEALFDGLDTNRDGYLDIHELTQCLGQTGLILPPQDLAVFHADCDTNRDGRITLNEFLAAVQRHR